MAGEDYLRMQYKVLGSRSQALVQLEAKKVKVRCDTCTMRASIHTAHRAAFLHTDTSSSTCPVCAHCSACIASSRRAGAPRPSQRVILADNRDEADSSSYLKPEQ